MSATSDYDAHMIRKLEADLAAAQRERDAATADAAAMREALFNMIESYLEEHGSTPTSDGHPFFAARAALATPGPGAALLERHASEVAALVTILMRVATKPDEKCFCALRRIMGIDRECYKCAAVRVLADLPAAGRELLERLRVAEKSVVEWSNLRAVEGARAEQAEAAHRYCLPADVAQELEGYTLTDESDGDCCVKCQRIMEIDPDSEAPEVGGLCLCNGCAQTILDSILAAARRAMEGKP